MPLFQENRLESWPPTTSSVASDWRPTVEQFTASTDGQRLTAFLGQRLASNAVIYPQHPLRALELTPLHAVRVVILGQDPYHGAGQAEGLAFSVPSGISQPPSLRNIFKELQREKLLGGNTNGSLAHWATQGVLLLNTSLTVEDGQPASHAQKGWETLTDAVVAKVAATAPVCVYLLWGAHAQAKAPMVEQITASHHRLALVLRANHPSPLSALRPPVPFIGCGHFRQANEFLRAAGSTPITWSTAG
ncbi:uracil-DNA glycosylase [Rhodoferax sp.]|uniref:uracil-DNA glycosylase n=1 Tax=Rhodoferax sp. TaxID=50421 RepID=UPI00374D3EA7